MNLYSVRFRWFHRKFGAQDKLVRIEAPSVMSALRQTSKQFMKERSAKDKFDIKINGLRLELIFIKKIEKETHEPNQETA